jgi:hypothetical protein
MMSLEHSRSEAPPIEVASKLADAASKESFSQTSEEIPQNLVAQHAKRVSISVLVSFIVHLSLLLVLAIWTIGLGTGRGDGLTIESGESNGGEFQSFEMDSTQIEEAQVDSVQQSSSLASQQNAEILSKIIDEQSDPSETPIGTSELVLQATSSSSSATGTSLGFAEMSLEGRSQANRAAMVEKNGGNQQSEQAVAWALAYLAGHQLNDGSWSMNYQHSCNHQCTPGCDGQDPYRFAATGLALMCFLGAGHTQNDEQYGEVVSKGIYFLQQNLRRTSDSGYWVDTVASAQMYEHGIATLALCEAYQMTRAKELKESCQLAINFILKAQFRDGGWDYHPGRPGDLSIAGWQVLALKSAAATDLVVPREAVQGIDRFIDLNRASEFMFRYRGGKPTKSMTAIGVLLQIFRGKTKDARSIAGGIEYLAKQGPSGNDMYYNYYATQAMFQIGGRSWKNWNYYMRDLLIRTQRADGHQRGSWMFEGDHSNRVGGRFYSTCMGCLILEVYYRYLPVYEPSSDDFRF